MTSPISPPTVDHADGPGEPDGARTARGRRLAPWLVGATAVAVTALVAGGFAVADRDATVPSDTSPGQPAELRIGTPFPGNGAADITDDPAGARAGRYLFTGNFPSAPDQGSVWRLNPSAGSQELATSLASALGFTDPPSPDADGWTARQGLSVLRIYDAPGTPFAFDAAADDGACPSIPTDGYGGPDTAVGCAIPVEPDGGAATGPASTPMASDSDVARIAADLAAVIGMDAIVTTQQGRPYSTANLAPSVDGAPTAGLSSTLIVGESGVLAASGWLAPLIDGALIRDDSYPLRSSKDSFGDLASAPMPAIACPEMQDEASAMLCGGDLVLERADYGLVTADDAGRPVLVPAWLFSGQGAGPATVAVVAVQRAFLADPMPADDDGGGAVSPGYPGDGAVS
jgi:hypothetical protein